MGEKSLRRKFNMKMNLEYQAKEYNLGISKFWEKGK